MWLNLGCIFTKTYLHCTNVNTHSYLCAVYAVKCNILTSIQLRESLWTHSDCVHKKPKMTAMRRFSSVLVTQDTNFASLPKPYRPTTLDPQINSTRDAACGRLIQWRDGKFNLCGHSLTLHGYCELFHSNALIHNFFISRLPPLSVLGPLKFVHKGLSIVH